MKNMKRFFCLLTLALLGFALLAGCGSSGRKWRDTDVIDDYGTVTRNGKQIDVCVCHDQKAVYLYYDDEEHEQFDTAKLPTDEIRNYDDVSYRVFDLDEGVFIWDEDTYYRME